MKQILGRIASLNGKENNTRAFLCSLEERSKSRYVFGPGKQPWIRYTLLDYASTLQNRTTTTTSILIINRRRII